MVGWLPLVSPPPSGGGGGAFSWKQLKVGGGGAVSGIQIANDGTRIARTDTASVYTWQPGATKWVPSVTYTSMPSGIVRGWGSDAQISDGFYAIAIAPSNSSIMYFHAPVTPTAPSKGFIYKSTNGGTTWANTGFISGGTGGFNVFPNDQPTPNARLATMYMGIDPNQPNVVYTSTPSNGMYRSIDGGATWAVVSAVGNGSTPAGADSGQGNLIKFDISGGTIVVSGQTRTKNVFVSTYGTGVFKSTDGGVTWTLLNSAGMPTTHVSMDCGADGVLWLVDKTTNSSSTGVLNRYNGSWSNQSSSMTNGGHGWDDPTGLTVIAADPSHSGHVYAMNFAGGLWYTLNSGTSWNGPCDFNATGTIGWLTSNINNNHYIGAATCGQIDPNNGELVIGTGIGSFKCTPPTAGTPVVQWSVDGTAGLENLDSTFGRSSPPSSSFPNGALLCSFQDRPFFAIDSVTLGYPSTYGPASIGGVNPGTSIEFARSNPSFVVGTSGNIGASFSNDGGSTWSNFATQPSGTPGTNTGGNIAAYSSSNVVYLLQSGLFHWNGTVWAPCTITGGSNANGGWYFGSFVWVSEQERLACDYVATTTYYAYNDGSGSNAQGIWKSTDGVTFSNVFSGSIGVPPGTLLYKLKCVPSNSGHLVFTPGVYINGTLDTTVPLSRSTNGGSAWSAIPNARSVIAFGFGKAGSSGYPSTYILGFVNVSGTWTFGIWQCDDITQATPVWVKISSSVDGDFPNGNYDTPIWLDGDVNVYGQCYYGYGGSGAAVYSNH